MKRGRPPKSTRLHLINGTYRRDRHGKRPDAPKLGAGLSEDQRILLAEQPPHLSAEAAGIYRESVINAHWLLAIDRGLLTVYVTAAEICRVASRGLDEQMRDPTFADPKSTAYQVGKAYNTILARHGATLSRLANELGFTPTSRQRLGIEAEQPKPAPDSPWAFLRPRPPDPTPG
jgi:phage terminase small subunit